ncbi:MAG TPA: non-ribosomal peptide synthetase, partial [Ktedonobacteraceae bacterium]|nr:non-ribosomal peptide synthetase [Ktedonobacteraceae bacterium]
QYAITIMQATPTTWRMLLETGWQGQAGLRILCGGEALTQELGSQLSQRSEATWNMYGPTETTIWSLIAPIHQDDATISIGRPIARTQVYILDQNWQLCPIGVVGEIYLGGTGVARGYAGRPDLTAERFIPDAWGSEKGQRLYRTGDLARYLPDGSLEFLGRQDTQVKFYGHRIELNEIEFALKEHPAVQDAVVLLQQSGDRQFLVACLLPVPARAIESQDLNRFLRQSLPEYMVPATFLTMDAFPMTSNNKVDRLALRKLSSTQLAPTQKAYVAPRTAIEVSLAEIWQEVFGLERVSCLDNFFEVGGDSILAVRVSLRAKAQGLHLMPQQLFQYQVLEDLAAQMQSSPLDPAKSKEVEMSPGTPDGSRFSVEHLSRRERKRLSVLLENDVQD